MYAEDVHVHSVRGKFGTSGYVSSSSIFLWT